MTEGEFFECRRTFGKQDQIQRVIGPVGNADLNRNHTKLLDCLKRGTIDFSRGVLLHPAGKIAYPQSLHSRIGVEINAGGYACDITWIGAGNSVQHQHCVLDAASHRAKFIERPAQRHCTGSRDATVGGA